MSVASVDLIQNHFNSFQSKCASEGKDSTRRQSQQPLITSSFDHRSNQSKQKQKHTSGLQSVKFETEALRQELIQNFIILQTSNLSLGNDDDRTTHTGTALNEDFKKQVSETLINIINSVFATIVSNKFTTYSTFSKSDYYDSSITLLEHVASFISIKGDGSLTTIVLNHVLQFSAAPDFESIRYIICMFIGWCSTNIIDSFTVDTTHTNKMSSSKKASQVCYEALTFLTGNDNISEDKAWRLECLHFIMTKFLSKRLTDKIQTVRNVAIHTSCLLLSVFLESKFIATTTNDDDHEYYDNEEDSNSTLIQEIVHSLMWNVTHDPSFANRSYVLQLFPVEKFLALMNRHQNHITDDLKTSVLQTIVMRVRDEKIKVRIDTFDLLRRVHVKNDLTIEMRCEILRQGFSKRYPATHSAAIKMLCCGWMKVMNYDPIATLDLFDPLNNDGIAENVAKAIIAATGTLGEDYDPFTDTNKDGSTKVAPISSDVTLMDLSDAEIRMFKSKCSEYARLSLQCSKTNEEENLGSTDQGLSPAMIVYLRTFTEVISKSESMTELKKNNLLSKFVPDVTTLTDTLEACIARLTFFHSHLNNDEDDEMKLSEYEDKEENECFVCLQLLKLATLMDLKEEGTRRHLSSIIHRILSSSDTHEDLIESCVHLIYVSSESEASFIQSISEILDSAMDEIEEKSVDASCSDETQAQYLRALEILTFSLEKISRHMSNNPILHNFSNIILNSISNYSLGPIIRELGIGCLGRFVILMDENTVVEKYKVLLMNIVLMEDEKDAIRAQSLLALCDLALLHHRIMAPINMENDENDSDVTFADILLDLMNKSSKSLLIVTAEVAVKLMCCGRLHDANILAHLIAVFFDQTLCDGSKDEESEDVNEVGSPSRLQQLMTIFFPAYTMNSSVGKHTLVASVSPLLSLLHEKMNKKVKGKKNNTSWPVARMIEYIIELLESESTSNNAKSDQIQLVEVSVSISSFLVKECEDLSKLHIRNLCKILSKIQIENSLENRMALSALKANIDELSICITDDSALNSLKYLMLVLEELPMLTSEEEDNKGEDNSARPVSIGSKNQNVDDQSVSDSSVQNHHKGNSSMIKNDDDSISSVMNRDKSTAENDEMDPSINGNDEDNDLPTFATLRNFTTSSNHKSSRLSNDSDTDLPLFATIGNSNETRNRKRQVIDSSSSESGSSEEEEEEEEEEFEDSFDSEESSSSSEDDDSYSD